ncbi:MAG: CpaD family pilus assembly lipoprotein [Rhodospirillaceae bacterium]
MISKQSAKAVSRAPANGAGMVLALLLLAGCSSAEPGAFPEPPQPKARASEVTARLALALPGRGGALTEAEHTQASAFFDAYREGGRGPLVAVVTAPNRSAGASAATALRDLAARRGLPAEALVVSSALGSPPGIALSFTDFVATAPGCDPEIVYSRNPTAEVSPNLGCAIENNFSAMIAHPADLLGPAPASAADGTRAARAIDLYHQGKATQGDVNRNDELRASDVGGK